MVKHFALKTNAAFDKKVEDENEDTTEAADTSKDLQWSLNNDLNLDFSAEDGRIETRIILSGNQDPESITKVREKSSDQLGRASCIPVIIVAKVHTIDIHVDYVDYGEIQQQE